MKPVTYSLCAGNLTSDEFYLKVSEVTDEILASMPEDIIELLGSYQKYITQYNIEQVRSKNEYYIEILQIGLFRNIYPEETLPLENWLKFLTSKRNDQDIFLKIAEQHALAFSKIAKEKLGIYTENVERFIEINKQKYASRNDRVYCLRSEAEYHLNMIGAEILNREYRNEFLRTKRRIVLLPTCMQISSLKCQAKNSKCMLCNKHCNIFGITTELEKQKIETILIPHSSEFSGSLKHWQNDPEVGLVGVACVLNLLKGGFELRKSNIPSQCVALDFCGCTKHWDNGGTPTKLNIGRLKNILNFL